MELGVLSALLNPGPGIDQLFLAYFGFLRTCSPIPRPTECTGQ